MTSSCSSGIASAPPRETQRKRVEEERPTDTDMLVRTHAQPKLFLPVEMGASNEGGDEEGRTEIWWSPS